MRTFVLALPLAGCISNTAVPLAMHPTASSSDRSVGVAVGGAYETQGGDSVVAVPYSEGWIRQPAGDKGQVGIHVGPSVVHFGYRYDVAPLSDGVGFAIEPMIGGSYFRFKESTSSPSEPVDEQSLLMLTAGIVPTLLFPAGKSFGYASLKLGLQSVRNLDAEMDQDDTNNSYVVGVSVGIGVSDFVSLELAVSRIDDLEDDDGMMTDEEAGWQIVPTIGVRH